VYTPLAVYVCDGDWLVDVLPSPKSHAQLVGAPVLVSVKFTVSGAGPVVVLAVKDAVGAIGPVVTVIVFDAVVDPFAFVAVSVAVKVPAA
jgi:hypothetical protein